jgi:hypothetical protein
LYAVYSTGATVNDTGTTADHSVDYVFDTLQPQHWLAKELLRAAEVTIVYACTDKLMLHIVHCIEYMCLLHTN